jgi:carbon-monoxide dehydrogenase large subunit
MHIAVVEVDVETGFLAFRGYYVLDDSGRVIHPVTVHGQIHGAVAHGIGGTIYEELPYDENGQLLASTFVDYLVPTAREVPGMEIDHMETPSMTPGGFKGMGEGGSIPTPAVIANAVEDALAPLGITVRETPLSPERVRRLLHDATRKNRG